MKILDNISSLVKDDLCQAIKKGSRVSIAAACFSMYAFEELKKQLEQVDEFRFIFTSPTFIKERAEKQKREFYIPRISREISLYGITRDLYLRRIVNDTRYKTLKDILPRVGDDSDISHKASIDLKNLNSSGWGSNEDADEELRLIFGIQKLLDYPKPVRLIEKLLASYRNVTDSIVLDFFSGSATTAHAVMQLNAEDGGHRKFIMVQLPEQTDEKSEAYKAGYKNICEIGKERIRRAGRKIRDDSGLSAADLDIGFRVLRLDSSNMQDVYYNPVSLSQSLLDLTTDNIKPDRTPEDLLFQVMLELGVLPSSTIVETEIDGKKVFDVADGFLLACFDKGVTTETVTAIAKKQPYYAVFRDASMADDSTATNFDQIFETYSPSTVRKVL